MSSGILNNVKRKKAEKTNVKKAKLTVCIHRRCVEIHHHCHCDLAFAVMSQPAPRCCDGPGEHHIRNRQQKSLEYRASTKKLHDVHTGSNSKSHIVFSTAVFVSLWPIPMAMAAIIRFYLKNI